MFGLARGAEERHYGAKETDSCPANRHPDHLNAIYPQQGTAENAAMYRPSNRPSNGRSDVSDTFVRQELERAVPLSLDWGVAHCGVAHSGVHSCCLRQLLLATVPSWCDARRAANERHPAERISQLR